MIVINFLSKCLFSFVYLVASFQWNFYKIFYKGSHTRKAKVA